MRKRTLPQTIKRKLNEFLISVDNYKLGNKLQIRVEDMKSDFDKAQYDFNQLTREHMLYKKRNNGLKDLEKHLLNGSSSGKSKNTTTSALLDEIGRLMKIVSQQEETIQKDPFLTSRLPQLRKPKYIKSKSLIKSFKNYVSYKKDLNLYNLRISKTNGKGISLIVEKSKDGLTIERTEPHSYKSDYIKEYDTYIQVGDNLKRIYYLADIPAYLGPYVFFRLLTSSLPFSLSIFIEPTSSAELLKKAKQRLSVLEMQQNERLKQGKLRDQQIDKNIEEVASFTDELVHEDEKGIVYSMYLQLRAENQKDLTTHHKELQNIAGAMDVTFNQYTFGQKRAFKNFLPFNTDSVRENRIMQSTAASYLMPFVSKQLNDPDGIFLGVNPYNSSLVFVNPFTSRNNNVNIFGVSGSGKSVTAKLLIQRLYMRGVKIIVIDPEGEYIHLAKALGGEVIQFSRENGINPFYVSSSREDDILDHISTLKTFFKFFIPPSHYDGAVLDEKLIELYDKRSPNFEYLLKLLKGNPMQKDLSVLSTGSLRGIFNSKRKLDLSRDIIVLDLQGLKKDEKRDPAMYLLTSLIWNLVNKDNDKQRMLFIDEAHKLLVDSDVAVFYRELVKQARKRNVGVVSITQDVEDFLVSPYGKAIITNSETKILLKQSYATLGQIGTIYPMTSVEKQQLGHLAIGEVILFREEEHIRLDVLVLPHERQLVFTSIINEELTGE